MKRVTDDGRRKRIRRILPVLALALGGLAFSGCPGQDQKSSKPASAAKPATGRSTSGGTSGMFRNMKQRKPLPPPPEDKSGPGDVQAELPSLTLDFEMSPECKEIEAQQKALRKKIKEHEDTVVAPASRKVEEAYDAYQDCQDDPGCMNSLQAYQARQMQYNKARRAQDKAEKVTQDLEIQLYELSQKFAAKCDTNPL